MMKNPLISNLYLPNNINFMNQNIYYQPKFNMMNFNPTNMNYMPYQNFPNNFNNYQSQLCMNNPLFFMNNSNKFDYIYSNNYQKPFFSKNNWNPKNNEFIKLKKEETAFNDKESNNKKSKKYSIDSADSDKSSNTSTDGEINEEEDKDAKNSKLKDTENKNKDHCYPIDDDYDISKAKKGGRRFSNTSKASNCSKYSTSTTDTLALPINEKDFLMEGLGKIKDKDNDNEKINKGENKVEKYEGNPEFENTVILNVNVKLSKDRTAVFKLKRFDDLFLTIKLFCEINSVDEKFMKPLIIKSLSTLNTIYQVMNSRLENNQINTLKQIKNLNDDCK